MTKNEAWAEMKGEILVYDKSGGWLSLTWTAGYEPDEDGDMQVAESHVVLGMFADACTSASVTLSNDPGAEAAGPTTLLERFLSRVEDACPEEGGPTYIAELPCYGVRVHAYTLKPDDEHLQVSLGVRTVDFEREPFWRWLRSVLRTLQTLRVEEPRRRLRRR